MKKITIREAQKTLDIKVDGVLGRGTAAAIVKDLKNGFKQMHGLKLSKWFTLGEFLESQTATRKGIANVPTVQAIISMHRLAVNVLDPVREEFGPIRISSGYRSYRLNLAIGGSLTSQHGRGEAADIIPYKASVLEVCTFIRDKLKYDQLIYEFGSWCHVSYRKDRLRHDWKSAIRARFGRTRYLPRVFRK